MTNDLPIKPTTVNIVADIGGTNLRIGTVSTSGEVESLEVYRCADYQGLADIIQHYVSAQNLSGKCLNACLAIACPADNDEIKMTNLPWKFSQSALKSTLQLNTLYMINDYTAIAHAAPFLNDKQKVKIGAGMTVPQKPISICGPGTGLGVSNVVFHNQQCITISGEGGHVDFAPTNSTEAAILNFLLTKYQHVSYEQLLSGLGIEQIYQAISHIKQQPVQSYTAAKISEKAIDRSCDICHQTLLQFCKILGAFAGNLSLTFGSFGGVYIAGGIVPRFIEFLQNSEFRQAFEAKGRFAGFNQKIPTYVITEEQPGILGAAAYLRQQISH
ncbi:glucokinase [Colwellia sp. E2M01]|nr:glucokinase [Colwellia sp. E2M01]